MKLREKLIDKKLFNLYCNALELQFKTSYSSLLYIKYETQLKLMTDYYV